MKHRHFVFTILFILLAGYLHAQQTKNQRDAQGRKQGYWEAVDKKGFPVYTGYFKDDKPVGEMKRYHPEGGGIRVIMQYSQDGEKAYSRFYGLNGKLAAEGNYVQTKRDSIWTFYNYHTGNLSYKTGYRMGMRQGKSQAFYPGGSVAEEVSWNNDLKDGPWKQYFESGQLKLSATYKKDMLEGSFLLYFPDGKKQTDGKYLNGRPDGNWLRYNENGSVAITIKYKNGIIANYDELTEAQQEIFKKMEETKIKEPTIEEMMREAQKANR
ncbi:MAG: toxin-antitoxin system YwqK family antitoxin [Bacteroidales bacterium]|jgi:antitoxin component YwqK of YwqJK toxin-antitoxin module|nr:toxin-antitoxin system YwqK family antitoxin [Bacteroidales bacterium]